MMFQLNRCYWCGDLATDVDDDYIYKMYVCDKHKDSPTPGAQLNTDRQPIQKEM